MQFKYILASVAFFAAGASAASYDSVRAEARAAVRSLLDEYEELQARQLCHVSGTECVGNVKNACGILCNNSPCAWNNNYQNKEVLRVCKEKCRCSGTASPPTSPIKVTDRKTAKA